MGKARWQRLRVPYTPQHGSWLTQAEIESSRFSRPGMGKRRSADRATLKREARAWNRRINRERVIIQWNFDRQIARRTFGYQKNLFRRSKNKRGKGRSRCG